ncbi:MAG: penicillin acylase family protein [Deltaproteobacteria bacterium]|nr:penicillin acylase family protein [Deltaproteobacteria bacterium]
MRFMTLIGLCGLIAAAGCSGSDTSGTGPGGDYSATIVRTTYGVPHITADNYGDLGFGNGYAYAQDNVCLLMREIVAANGQTARYFGEDEGNVADDFVYTLLNSSQVIEEEFFPALTDTMIEALRGARGVCGRLQSIPGGHRHREPCGGLQR